MNPVNPVNSVNSVVVTDAMQAAGNTLASYLFEVAMQKHALGNRQLSRDDFGPKYTGENLDLINSYLANEIEFVTAIYIAMYREKEGETGDPIVTNVMKEAGKAIASDLINASVSKDMGGLGGSLTWADYVANYKGPHLDLINDYLDDKIDSLTAIYIAMHRES